MTTAKPCLNCHSSPPRVDPIERVASSRIVSVSGFCVSACRSRLHPAASTHSTLLTVSALFFLFHASEGRKRNRRREKPTDRRSERRQRIAARRISLTLSFATQRHLSDVRIVLHESRHASAFVQRAFDGDLVFAVVRRRRRCSRSTELQIVARTIACSSEVRRPFSTALAGCWRPCSVRTRPQGRLTDRRIRRAGPSHSLRFASVRCTPSALSCAQVRICLPRRLHKGRSSSPARRTSCLDRASISARRELVADVEL